MHERLRGACSLECSLRPFSGVAVTTAAACLRLRGVLRRSTGSLGARRSSSCSWRRSCGQLGKGEERGEGIGVKIREFLEGQGTAGGAGCEGGCRGIMPRSGT